MFSKFKEIYRVFANPSNECKLWISAINAEVLGYGWTLPKDQHKIEFLTRRRAGSPFVDAIPKEIDTLNYSAWK